MSLRRVRILFLVCIVGLLASLGPLSPASVALAATLPVVDDFETTLNTNVYDSNGIPIGFFVAQDGGSQTTFSRTDSPPSPVPGAASPNSVLQMGFNVAAYGVVIHGFENDAANQWVTQDWSTYGGMSFWLYGNNSGTDLFVDLIDNRQPGATNDSAERFTVTFKDDFSGWKLIELPFESFVRKEIGNGAPNDGLTLTEVHGWAFGTLTTATPQTFYLDDVRLYGTAPERPLTVSFALNTSSVTEGRTARVVVKLSKPASEPVTVEYEATHGQTNKRDVTLPKGKLTFAPGVVQQTIEIVTLEDAKDEFDEGLLLRLKNPSGAVLGTPPTARLVIVDNDATNPLLLDDFEIDPYLFRASSKAKVDTKEISAKSSKALPGQIGYERVLELQAKGNQAATIERRFPQAQDWSAYQGLSFWYYGHRTNKKITVNLLDNQQPDPGPSGWKLVWSDEFNTSKNTKPNEEFWGYEIGDGTVNGIPGWGNSELQYYTDKRENAATDGKGNLVITARAADGSLQCYYGPCQYTSARLLTKNRFEVAFGRIETRVKVPRGAGLWPAFWALGTDIDKVGWPQSGEIDIMEHVAREPYRVFGTIHGPGYSGGQGFGNVYDLTEPVADQFHTFAVEWEPGEIRWYIDGIEYHRATAADVAPNEWVYDHPFFLLLNLAVGGNFGGAVGSDTTFPQQFLVDYVRVYQATDTAERFKATFTDNFSGWKRITIPFSSFKRDSSPKNAPKDGLTLTSVHGYGFEIPKNYPKKALIDQVQLVGNCSEQVVVQNTNDSGPGSLRQALSDVCFGGTISFAPSLANKTIGLYSSELTIDKPVTIDGANAPGLVISGSNTVRPFVINASVTATIRNLTISNGYGFELAGGILNNGTLTLESVKVVNNQVETSGEDYWKGGAGIYSGENSTLTVRDSTVADNSAADSNGGGVYAFFNSIVLIERSTISGNSANVGGGLRTLGDIQIINSTISGNSTYGWMGGAFFHTDGTMHVLNSSIVGNSAPAGSTGGAFVGTFTDANATLVFANTLLSGNSETQCFVAPWGSGVVTLSSQGNNLATDDTCAPSASDLVVGDALIGPLADNGGPTLTHALLPGSPAIDAANRNACPKTDQRGQKRPYGKGCDIGAFELRSKNK